MHVLHRLRTVLRIVAQPDKIMRERVILECTECGERNYMTTLNTKGGKKLEIKKYCPKTKTRTLHKSRKV